MLSLFVESDLFMRLAGKEGGGGRCISEVDQHLETLLTATDEHIFEVENDRTLAQEVQEFALCATTLLGSSDGELDEAEAKALEETFSWDWDSGNYRAASCRFSAALQQSAELMQTALKQDLHPDFVRVARSPSFNSRAKADGVDLGVPEGWEQTLMEDGLFITRLGDGEWISHAHERWTIQGQWRKSQWGELSEEGALYRIPWPNKELEALRALG